MADPRDRGCGAWEVPQTPVVSLLRINQTLAGAATGDLILPAPVTLPRFLVLSFSQLINIYLDKVKQCF